MDIWLPRSYDGNSNGFIHFSSCVQDGSDHLPGGDVTRSQGRKW